MKHISSNELRAVLEYDPATGIFTWRISHHNVAAGAIAGGVNGKGYHRIQIKGRAYATHRLAWMYVYGEFPRGVVDHINGNPVDNRICNLRSCTQQQNAINNRRSPVSKSGFRGVYWNISCNKWQATIGSKGRLIYLGVFSDKSEAIAARRRAETQLHGEFSPNHALVLP